MLTRGSLDASAGGSAPAVAYFCQVCRARLIITGAVEASDGKASAGGAAASALYDGGPGKIDESFIVLDDRRGPAGEYVFNCYFEALGIELYVFCL